MNLDAARRDHSGGTSPVDVGTAGGGEPDDTQPLLTEVRVRVLLATMLAAAAALLCAGLLPRGPVTTLDALRSHAEPVIEASPLAGPPVWPHRHRRSMGQPPVTSIRRGLVSSALGTVTSRTPSA
jgi:hypothetical protein